MTSTDLAFIVAVLKTDYLELLNLRKQTYDSEQYELLVNAIDANCSLVEIELPILDQTFSLQILHKLISTLRQKKQITRIIIPIGRQENQPFDRNLEPLLDEIAKLIKSNQIESNYSNDTQNKQRTLRDNLNISEIKKFIFCHLDKRFHQDYIVRFFLEDISQNESNLTAELLPQGLLVLKEIESSVRFITVTDIIRYGAKEFNITNPEPLRKNSEKKLSQGKFGETARATKRLWKTLFPEKENIHCAYQGYAIQSDINKPIDTITDINYRDFYIPVAFSSRYQVQSGMYLNLWHIGKNNYQAIKSEPIAQFFTGYCMFGDCLFGLDEAGIRYSLTNPKFKLPKGKKITSIETPATSLHPDELLAREILTQAVPFIKTLSQGRTPELICISAAAPYIIHGIARYVAGEFTITALNQYAQFIAARAAEHRQYYADFSAKYDVIIDNFMTLDLLGLEQTQNNVFEHLLQKIGLLEKYKANSYSENLADIAHEIAEQLINFMAQQSGKIGLAWQRIKQKIEDKTIQLDNDPYVLHRISYFDYSIRLAISVIDNPNKVCAFLPTFEKAILLNYKHFFSDFGSVLCVNYIPPIILDIERYNYVLFYLQNHLEKINRMIAIGLVNNLFLQTAAIALDDVELAKMALNRAMQLLEDEEQRISVCGTKEKTTAANKKLVKMEIKNHFSEIS